jgi:hypothetical protein
MKHRNNLVRFKNIKIKPVISSIPSDTTNGLT